jgi:cystathionine beta-lyase
LEHAARSSDPRQSGDFATLCQHYGEHRLAHGGGAAPPIYQSSLFVFPDAEAWATRDRSDAAHFVYTRRANPTTAILEAKLAGLENGSWCRCFASGMGAITTALSALLAADTHVVVVNDCYHPTRTYLTTHLARFGVTTTFVRGTDPAAFIDAFRDETRVIYLESPTTGRMDVIDLAPIVTAARQRGIVTMFDNSWASPYFQRPLELGLDLVLHSATKYIGGHSDTVGGVVVGRDETLRQKINAGGELLGASADPFAAWLLIRGLRTLPLRMEQHQKTGLAVANLLAQHPAVARVYHPGLPTYANHAVARKQLRGYGGLFAFTLRDQSQAAVHRFMNRLRVFSIGVSWGGFESLVVAGDASELFAPDPDQPRWIIRLHCGLEATEDLVDDVRQALEE